MRNRELSNSTIIPIEQVWSWIRQHCLSNRVFSGYEEIVEQVSQAWNKFISVPDTVKSICSRDWIKLIPNTFNS